MKIFRTMILMLALIFSVKAEAGNWSIRCENASCVASQGALKVYWMANSFTDIYRGRLTGVEGIPVSIDDYQAVEKKIESAIEKSVTRKKGGDTGVRADAPEGMGGPTAGTTGSKENLFTKKRSMSQSKTAGKKVSVDYTLAFVEWLGDTWYGHDHSIQRYWAAAEQALGLYKRGDIEEMIETFFLARNGADIEQIAIDTPINDENRKLILTKYLGLTRWSGVADPQARYAKAAILVSELATNPIAAQTATQISEDFKNDLKSLKVLMKPNLTAAKLYKKDKELAFVKWLGDTSVVSTIVDTRDRYIAAMFVVRATDEKNRELVKSFRDEFEVAIKNNDKSVQIVTVKGSPIPIMPVAVITGLGFLIGIVVFIRRRKNQQEGEK